MQGLGGNFVPLCAGPCSVRAVMKAFHLRYRKFKQCAGFPENSNQMKFETKLFCSLILNLTISHNNCNLSGYI